MQEVNIKMLKGTLLEIAKEEKATADVSMCKQQIIDSILSNRRKNN